MKIMGFATAITPVGRISFPALFEPKPNRDNPSEKPKYEINLIFDRAAQKTEAFARLEELVEDVVKSEWGSKRPKKLNSPIKDGAERDYNGYGEGTKYVRAWSYSRPGVVGPDRNDIIDANAVWSGQKARASVAAVPFSRDGNSGVLLLLNNVQITSLNEERLDGRRSARDEFDDGEVEDPTE
jgi:hypothetical protein